MLIPSIITDYQNNEDKKKIHHQHHDDAEDGDGEGEIAELALREYLDEPYADEAAEEDEGNGAGIDEEGVEGDVIPHEHLEGELEVVDAEEEPGVGAYEGEFGHADGEKVDSHHWSCGIAYHGGETA